MTTQQSLITIAVRAAAADAPQLGALTARFGGSIAPEGAGKRSRWEKSFDLVAEPEKLESDLAGSRGAREILAALASTSLPASAEIFCTVVVSSVDETEEESAAIDDVMLALERLPAARFTLDCH